MLKRAFSWNRLVSKSNEGSVCQNCEMGLATPFWHLVWRSVLAGDVSGLTIATNSLRLTKFSWPTGTIIFIHNLSFGRFLSFSKYRQSKTTKVNEKKIDKNRNLLIFKKNREKRAWSGNCLGEKDRDLRVRVLYKVGKTSPTSLTSRSIQEPLSENIKMLWISSQHMGCSSRFWNGNVAVNYAKKSKVLILLLFV